MTTGLQRAERAESPAPPTAGPTGEARGHDDLPDGIDRHDGRTQHYGAFYGVHEIDDDDRPLVVVIGNCQAESLRVLLDGEGTGAVRSVRVPPVFELSAAEMPLLASLLQRADRLVVQPIRDDYRGLALGTSQLAAHLRPDARVVRVPVVRYAGLHPYQAIVRVPPLGDPPVVPYLDLRTVVEAATGTRPRSWCPDGIRAVADASVAQLRVREQAAGTVPVADLLRPSGAQAVHTINHPGNAVLIGLAQRVQEALGLPATAHDPGRVLLAEVDAPLYPQVLDALGLDAEPRPSWRLRGADLDDETVRRTQLAWLRAHPQVVDAAAARCADTVRALGWA